MENAGAALAVSVLVGMLTERNRSVMTALSDP